MEKSAFFEQKSALKNRYTNLHRESGIERRLTETLPFTIYDLLLIIWFLLCVLGVLRGKDRRLTEIYLELARPSPFRFV